MIAEAALADDGFAAEARAVWRRRHPEYLRSGTALEQLSARTFSEPPSMFTFGNAVRQAIHQLQPDHVMYMHVGLARLAPMLAPTGHPDYSVWLYGVEAWSRLSAAHRIALRRAQRVLAISNYTARIAADKQSLPLRDIKVVPLCLPESAFDAPASTCAFQPERLLAVSRLDATEKGKNLEALVSAMPVIHHRFPSAKLVIVGDGDLRPELERLASRLGIAHIVEFAGRVSDERLELEYQLADLFVLPSEKEGFGLVFIEAMLRDTPVVGFAAGGAVDVVRDGIDGALIEDIRDLPACITGLLEDRAHLDDIRSTVRARVEEAFSPRRFRADLRPLVQSSKLGLSGT